MTTALSDLYRDVILEHSKRPRNFRRLAERAAVAEAYNPLCGDTVAVYVDLMEGVARDVAFHGTGCALATAAASVMTEAVRGRTLAEIAQIGDAFGALVTRGCALPDAMPEALAAFAGVRSFPSRVKCTLLAWQALRAALRLPD